MSDAAAAPRTSRGSRAAEARHRAAQRVLLAVLAVSALVPGAWATLAPRGVYEGFPGLGWAWVPAASALDAHLLAALGAFYLAWGVLLAWAVARPERALVVPACVGWSVFSVLHLGWHAANPGPLDPGAVVGQLVALASVLALPAAILWIGRRRSGAR